MMVEMISKFASSPGHSGVPLTHFQVKHGLKSGRVQVQCQHGIEQFALVFAVEMDETHTHYHREPTTFIFRGIIEGSLNRNFRQYGELKSRCIAQQ